MKNYILFALFILISSIGITQDTLQYQQYYGGGKVIEVRTKKDTTFIGYYANGKIESKHLYHYNQNSSYKRFYPNGKLMYEMNLIQFIPNGGAKFYDTKGKLIGQLNFVNGQISDTIYLSQTSCLIFGKVYSSSTVYGGMEREDGSSNVQEYSSELKGSKFKLIETDSLEQKNKLNISLITDQFGFFSVVIPRKNAVYGIFPDTYKTTEIDVNQEYPSSDFSGSTSTSWSLNGSLIIDPLVDFRYIELRCNSIGYAP